MGMAEVTWVIPAIQSVHIMAIAVVVGSALMVDLRLLGAFGEGESVAAFTRRFLPWLWWALLALLLTGVLMIVAEPRRSLQNTTFLVKMGLVLAAVAVTALTRLPLSKAHRRPIAVVSMCLWVAIIFCGRWISYTQDM